MAYLNKVMLIGNLGKDPEIRLGQQSGRKCVSFSLATSRRYRDANGEQKEETQWHNVVGWGKVADIFEQLGIRKGTSLYVEGRLATRSWTDNGGQKRYATEVNLETFQVLTPRNQQPNHYAPQGNPYAPQQQAQPAQSDAQAYGSPSYDDDDDLPF